MTNSERNTKFSLLKGFIGFSLSSWVNAGLSLLSTPIITRTFSPNELGKIHLFITLVNMLMNFAYLGIDQAFTRFYNEPPGKNDKKSLLSVCLILTGGIAAVVFIGIVFFREWISSTIVGYISFIIPVSVIISVGSNIIIRFLNLAARMQKNIILFNIQAILTTVISNLSYVAAVAWTPTAEAAIVIRTTLLLVAAVIFFAIVFKESMSLKIDIRKSTVKEILVYALPICPAAILSIANNSVGQILLKNYVDYTAVGIYSNAVTVAAIITIVQSGLEMYWGPLVFENYKTKQKMIIKVQHIISFMMIFFGIMIILFQDVIYGILIGKAFWASKRIFPLLLISPICYTISECLGIGIRIAKKTFLNIPVYVINIIVNLGLCVLLLPRIGEIGAAVASATASVSMLVVKSIFGEREYHCTDNYLKVIVALIVLIGTAVIHVFIYDMLWRYLVYIVALTIISLVYWRQIREILHVIVEIMNKFLKRNRI